MKQELKYKTIQLRKKGYSVNELHMKYGVSKSTISRWVGPVQLSKQARARLDSCSTNARVKAEKTIRAKTQQKLSDAYNFAQDLLGQKKMSSAAESVICSMIYFCEGGKSNGVNFVNSDPSLVILFLTLLRTNFKLEEKKFRVLMQLHDYHDEQKQKMFWSKITGIPKGQFHKSYIKPNNHKYKKEGYEGCINVRYYDENMARKLSAIAKSFMERYK